MDADISYIIGSTHHDPGAKCTSSLLDLLLRKIQWGFSFDVVERLKFLGGGLGQQTDFLVPGAVTLGYGGIVRR